MHHFHVITLKILEQQYLTGLSSLLHNKKLSYILFKEKKIKILINKSIPISNKICRKVRHITSFFGTTHNKRCDEKVSNCWCCLNKLSLIIRSLVSCDLLFRTNYNYLKDGASIKTKIKQKIKNQRLII